MALPTPRALTEAVAETTRVHPYAARGRWNEAAPRLLADAERLWARLTQLTPRQRADTVRALNAMEVRTLAVTARSRFDRTECVDILAELLEAHVVPGGPGLAWEAYLRTDGRAPFGRVAAPYVDQLVARETYRALLAAQPPSARAAALYLAQRASFRAWAASPAVALAHATHFLGEVQRRLLHERGLLAQVDMREPIEPLAEWVATLVPVAQRDTWDALFLVSSYEARRRVTRQQHQPWPAVHGVLEAIYESRGAPVIPHRFWEAVEPPVRAAFANWLKDRQLTKLLGENDRVEFWRRYLPSMIESVPNSDRTVIFVRFPGWFAVQFKNSGTATYLFADHHFRGRRRESELQLQRFVRGNPDALGAYDHRGYTWTWQSTAGSVVERVRRQFAEVQG